MWTLLARQGPSPCCLCKRLSIIALPVTPASCFLSLRLTLCTRHYIGSCWGCRVSLFIHAAGRCRLGSGERHLRLGLLSHSRDLFGAASLVLRWDGQQAAAGLRWEGKEVRG